MVDDQMHYFVQKDITGQDDYLKGVRLDEIFDVSSTGVFTLGDDFIVNDNRDDIAKRVNRIIDGGYSESEMNTEFNLGKNYAHWVTSQTHNDTFRTEALRKYTYRPFDEKYTYFDKKFIWRLRQKVTDNFSRDNLALNVGRQGMVVGKMQWNVCLATNSMVDLNLFYRGGEQVFLLFTYTEDGEPEINLRPSAIASLTANISSSYTPYDIFDYLYAVLHSPAYRTKYAEFLQTDFPRVPVPTQEEFDRLVPLGRRLRELHLMTSAESHETTTNYLVPGTNTVEKVAFQPEVKSPEAKDSSQTEIGRVYINDTQYFGNVPRLAWEFYIGGYQPAQKWLKDRRGRTLTDDDCTHYRRIITILTRTHAIMQEIG
jgi:predicted helicase